jgi:hypothetical protein
MEARPLTPTLSPKNGEREIRLYPLRQVERVEQQGSFSPAGEKARIRGALMPSEPERL